MRYAFRVYGRPAPQGSKRSIGNHRFKEASEHLLPWREAIKAEILRHGYHRLNITGPVSIRLRVMFKRPQSHYGTRKGERYLKDNAPVYKASTPDLDKVQRSVGDALAQGGMLHDDDLIVRWDAAKMYEEWEGAEIVVETYD